MKILYRLLYCFCYLLVICFIVYIVFPLLLITPIIWAIVYIFNIEDYVGNKACDIMIYLEDGMTNLKEKGK